MKFKGNSRQNKTACVCQDARIATQLPTLFLLKKSATLPHASNVDARLHYTGMASPPLRACLDLKNFWPKEKNLCGIGV
jgi:hypothetical protein